jgi:hypothetical protein
VKLGQFCPKKRCPMDVSRLTDLCQFDILQSGLGWQGTEGNPIRTYDVLIAGQAMAPNLMGSRGRGERDDGAVVDASQHL